MDKISEAKKSEGGEGVMDGLKRMFEKMAHGLGLRERREVVPAKYHSAEAQMRAFNRGMRAVRRHRRLRQGYPLPRHIQDKLSMK